MLQIIYGTLGGWHDLEEAQKYFKEFGLEKEAESAIKSVWNIRNEIENYAS